MIETFLELGAHQVSLLDLLRLLRQRRKEDEEAQVFVVEQLRRAEAIATQASTKHDSRVTHQITIHYFSPLEYVV